MGLTGQSPTHCYFIHSLPHSFILSFPRRGLKTCGVPSPVQGQTRPTGHPRRLSLGVGMAVARQEPISTSAHRAPGSAHPLRSHHSLQ